MLSLLWLLLAADFPQPAESTLWEQRLVDTAGAPSAQAARFAMQDGALRIGPYRAGRYTVRYETRRRFPIREGTVRGEYRTFDLLPGQAVVRINSYRGTSTIDNREYRLDATADWTPFRVPIRRLPPNAEAVNVGVGLVEHTEGAVEFRNVVVSDEPLALELAAGPGEITRPAPPTFEPGPFFRLAERDGVHWLVRPDGRAWFALAADPPSFELNPAGLERGRAFREQLLSLGFNSLAGWHSLFRWGPLNDQSEEPVPAFQVVASGGMPGDYARMTRADGATEGEHAFPDPFDPQWEAALRSHVAQRAALVKGKPWFVAWFAGNEMTHKELHRRVWSGPCSRELKRWLEERHGDIDTLNARWNSSYASFDDLIAKKPDPVLRTGAMYDDFHAFMRHAIRRWAEIVTRVIREYDPDHLVFSNRFMIGELRDWIENLDLYAPFDGIAINTYPANLSPGLAEREKNLFRQAYERTGKPVMITEWSVPALDSGLYEDWSKMDWSFPQCVDSQAQRGGQAARVTTDIYNLPFVVGAHWFRWYDYDSPDRYANRGLYKTNGEPWTELQESLKAANAAVTR